MSLLANPQSASVGPDEPIVHLSMTKSIETERGADDFHLALVLQSIEATMVERFWISAGFVCKRRRARAVAIVQSASTERTELRSAAFAESAIVTSARPIMIDRVGHGARRLVDHFEYQSSGLHLIPLSIPLFEHKPSGVEFKNAIRAALRAMVLVTIELLEGGVEERDQTALRGWRRRVASQE